jgi:glycosyltransferase involved in cell wall biosynthesis
VKDDVAPPDGLGHPLDVADVARDYLDRLEGLRREQLEKASVVARVVTDEGASLDAVGDEPLDQVAADEPSRPRDEDALVSGSGSQSDASLSRTSADATQLRVLLLGGINTPHVEDLALAIRELGVDVLVAGKSEPGLPPSSLARHGVATVALPWTPMMVPRPIRIALLVARIRKLLRSYRPQVVHAHELTVYPLHAIVAGARPLVATAWGSDVLRAGRAGRLRNTVIARTASLLTADSRDLLARLAALGAPPSRLMIFNWGVDLDAFSPGREAARARLGLPDVPVILSPRALRPLYNPGVILDAFARVAADVPDAVLLLKHLGDVVPELERLPYRDRVRVVGHVPAEEVPDYFRAADVCVSIPSSDSAPRTVWEAMACGCPCVLSDLPWIDDQIERGRDALVVPIDAAAVAEAIRSVLGDRRGAEALAQHGRALVERHHDRRVQAERLVEAYRTLARRALKR